MKVLTLVLMLLFLNTIILAQNQPVFDTSASVWYEFKESGEPPQHFYENYFIAGDTLIYGKWFHKIYKKRPGINDYTGSYREEGRKVYYCGYDYFFFMTDTTILLYDFGCGENDTVYTGTWHINIVQSTDSVFTGNKHRKRITMRTGEQWIEGIGSTWGFFYPMTEIPTMYWKSELSCFKINDTVIFLNPEYTDCTTRKGSSIYDQVDYNIISIFPNPLISHGNDIFIRCDNMQIKYISVLHMNGQVVYSEKVNNDNLFKVSSDDLMPGFYLVKIITNTDNCIYKKIIIR